MERREFIAAIGALGAGMAVGAGAKENEPERLTEEQVLNEPHPYWATLADHVAPENTVCATGGVLSFTALRMACERLEGQVDGEWKIEAPCQSVAVLHPDMVESINSRQGYVFIGFEPDEGRPGRGTLKIAGCRTSSGPTPDKIDTIVTVPPRDLYAVVNAGAKRDEILLFSAFGYMAKVKVTP